jgi:hypothetical protein
MNMAPSDMAAAQAQKVATDLNIGVLLIGLRRAGTGTYARPGDRLEND